MSTIFEASTQRRPRTDATIRVEVFEPGSTSGEPVGWLAARLLEFHLGNNPRLKQRSYAHVKATPGLLAQTETCPHLYRVQGVGFLKEPYIDVREWSIHPEDVCELRDYCQRDRLMSLIIHKCPLPFPIFRKGTRVMVLPYEDEYRDTSEDVGEEGIITEKSSPGGLSSVLLDNPARRLGFKSRGFPSIRLREANEKSH